MNETSIVAKVLRELIDVLTKTDVGAVYYEHGGSEDIGATLDNLINELRKRVEELETSIDDTRREGISLYSPPKPC